MYNKNIVIESFMKDELDKVPEGDIYDFVTGGDVIVDSWADHFRGIFNGRQLKYKTPFVITAFMGVKTLWKEKVM